MPKKYRVSHSDFKLAAASRLRRERGKYFMLSYGQFAEKGRTGPQFACVVSKKTAERAVDRNLIKRRCRSAARDIIASIEKPLALIFYANRNVRGASFAEVKRDVNDLLRKSTRVANTH